MPRAIKNYPNEAKFNLKGLPIEHKLPVNGLSHIVGQTAAIRFFDESSRSDFEAINEILTHRQIRNWMDDTGKLTWSDYRYWAGNHSNESFLFSVHDSRQTDPEEVKKIRGFVNIYSERGEKFRIKRMAKLGIIKFSKHKKYLEFSMAVRIPKKDKLQSSGLMSSALRQSCIQVKSILNLSKNSDLVIYGFLDPDNKSSVRAITAAGFIKKGKARYDSTSDKDSHVYILSWRKLQKLIEIKMDIAMRNKMKVVMEPQITDSHCGPAVIKALVGFYGIEVNQDQIVDLARVNTSIARYGMRPAQLAQTVKKLNKGLKFWYKQNASARDIDLLIHKYKVPVGVNWQGLFFKSTKEEKIKNTNDDRGHYSIVIDIDPKNNKIIIDDPYREYFEIPRVFSYKWFKTRWHDEDEIVNRKTKTKNIIKTKKFIFVVTPVNADFPQKLNMQDIKSLSELEYQETDKKTAVL